MRSFEQILKNELHNYIDNLYKKFKQYNYALICDNGEHYFELFGVDSNIDNERISKFMIDKYSYEVYILRTKCQYNYILIFNSSNCTNFTLNLLNISSLYPNSEINFKPRLYRENLLFGKFSTSELISIKQIELISPATMMGKWARSLAFEEIEKKLEKHKLHFLWFDISDLESLSISRYKHNEEFVWAMIHHDHYGFDSTDGATLIFFHQQSELVKQKVEEYINLLNQHKVPSVMQSFEILGTKWSGNELYKKFLFLDNLHTLNCELSYQEDMGFYYSAKLARF